MAYLSWISDEDLIEEVKNLLNVAGIAQSKAEKEFHKNVIDPFSALFEITGFKIDYTKWLISEKTRKSQKTLQNHIGDFHQRILGHVDGWTNLNVGKQVDLICEEKRILAEIKNKHNTVKKVTLGALYEELEQIVMPKASRYKDFTIYYVTIIPEKPVRFNLPFSPSNNKTGTRFGSNELIRKIDGASFYDLVTGKENSLKELYDCLPRVISEYFNAVITENDHNQLRQLFGKAYG